MPRVIKAEPDQHTEAWWTPCFRVSRAQNQTSVSLHPSTVCLDEVESREEALKEKAKIR